MWGIARNPLVDAGIINPYSKGIPWLIKAALARGRAGMVGKGLSLWSDVEIEECMATASSPSVLDTLIDFNSGGSLYHRIQRLDQ